MNCGFFAKVHGAPDASKCEYARACWRCTIHELEVPRWDAVQTPPPGPLAGTPPLTSLTPRVPAPGAPRLPPHRSPPVASQLPRAFVAYSMRLCYPSTIIWIYCTYALLPTSSSRICGFAKSLTNINGLYCKVHRETISFVRSALEFVCLADVFGTWLRNDMVLVGMNYVSIYMYMCYCKASVNIVPIHVVFPGYPRFLVETRSRDMAHSWRPRYIMAGFRFSTVSYEFYTFYFRRHRSTLIIM